jgi:hypothetical protein
MDEYQFPRIPIPNFPPLVRPLTIPPAFGGEATLSPRFKKPLLVVVAVVLTQNDNVKFPFRDTV